MCDQSRVLPFFSKLSRNFVRTEIMRSAIPFTSCSHFCRNSGSPKISLTIRAPLIGGFEYIGLIKIFNCDRTRAASSLLKVTMVNAPIRSPNRKGFQFIQLYTKYIYMYIYLLCCVHQVYKINYSLCAQIRTV